MKLALSLLTLTASGILGVLGSPALQTSNATAHPVPHGFAAFDVPESVDAAPAPLVPAHKDAVAASAVSNHYWVCIAVSSSSGHYGWSRGGSESSALQSAKKKCGKSDCKSYSCIEEGLCRHRLRLGVRGAVVRARVWEKTMAARRPV
ncbi:hypothetical protein B0H14DRAFT_3462012 [Mycena olivaceomarginata]|nr:hypothetical protein B0H14DRAFT_3462012 [Mycena olivaceomarginata]